VSRPGRKRRIARGARAAALVLSAVVVVGAGCAGEEAEVYDLVIANGRVVDPASGLDGVRSVGVRDGRVAALSEGELEGRRTIDASGLVVAPGFVDLHEHGQSPEAYRLMVRDGVTSAFELEVGTADVDAWYAERAGGQLVNHGVSIGHIPVRMEVLDDPGDFLPAGVGGHGDATEEQVAEMERRIEEGLGQGALAVGFGTAYTPGADMDEVRRMFEVAAAHDAPAHIHMRNGVAGLDSTIAAAADAGVPLHVVHVNYPYGAGMTRIESALFDDWREWPDSRFQRYQWVATGERMSREMFAEARERGGAVIIHSRSEEQTRTAVTSPLTMIASDGFIEDGQGHPRTSGSYSKVLGKYVREEGALDLVEALRKMTIMPARRLEERTPAMARKGRIEVGADADLTLFDPESVIDRSTYTDATIPAAGIPYVVVNGTVVVDEGEIGSRPRFYR